MNNSQMQRGSGIFPCDCCGNLTRHTGVQSVGVDMCPDCYELAGIYNAYQDGGEEALTEYAGEIRERCAAITGKGGKLDGDNQFMLDTVGES